jgi:hypothetical protein
LAPEYKVENYLPNVLEGKTVFFNTGTTGDLLILVRHFLQGEM